MTGFLLMYVLPPLATWMAFSAWFGWQRYRATRTCVPTTATVTTPGLATAAAVRSGNTLVEAGPRLTYEPWGEPSQDVHIRRRRLFLGYDKNRVLSVRYNPQHPEQVIVDDVAENGLAPVVGFACLLVVGAILGVLAGP